MAHSRRAQSTRSVALYTWLVCAGITLPLAAQNTPNAQSASASLQSARSLALAGRTDAALAIYDAMLSNDSADRSALLGSATTLAWARRFVDARERYAQLLTRWPSDLEAQQGLARLNSWSGRLAESEQQWRVLAARDSLNPELWVELAQVLRWSGALREADVTLDRARRLAPTNERVTAEFELLRAARARVVAPVLRISRDNEGNALTTLALGFEMPLEGRRSARLSAHNRGASFGALSGESRVIRASMQLPIGARTSMVAEGGAVQLLGAAAGDQTLPIGLLRLQSELAPWITVRASLAREVLDETVPMMQSALTANGASLSASTRLGTHVTMSTSGDVRQIESASAPNTQQQWQLGLERTLVASLSAGVRLRRTAHSRVATDGYFSPKRHDLGEIVGRWAPGPAGGWHAGVEAAAGRQQIDLGAAPQTGPSHRIDVSVARRWSAGGEIVMGYERSTVAGLAPLSAETAAAYRYHGVRLGARLPF